MCGSLPARSRLSLCATSPAHSAVPSLSLHRARVPTQYDRLPCEPPPSALSAPPRPPRQAFQSTKQRILLEEKLQAMHEAHAESLAKLDKQQVALAEQMGKLVDTVNKFVAPKPYSI